MFDDLDLDKLRRVPRISFYFRYPLRRTDFRELRIGGRLRGHYAAKPLYGRVTADGRVDRSGGLNGEIAVLFVPADAPTPESARLLLTRLDPERIVSPGGRRNWPAIRAAAERRLIDALAA